MHLKDHLWSLLEVNFDHLGLESSKITWAFGTLIVLELLTWAFGTALEQTAKPEYHSTFVLLYYLDMVAV